MGLFNSYNKVVVMGNMTRDAELRTIPSGAQVAEISVAVNDRIKRGNEWVEDTTFVEVTAWNKTAEFLQRFGGKGKCVLVEGRLKMEKWVDKQSGGNRSKLKVVAENITFVDSSPGGGSGGGGGGRQSSGAPSGGGGGGGAYGNYGGGGDDYGAPSSGETPYATDPSGFDEEPPF